MVSRHRRSRLRGQVVQLDCRNPMVQPVDDFKRNRNLNKETLVYRRTATETKKNSPHLQNPHPNRTSNF